MSLSAPVPFIKTQGTGNDFVLIDALVTGELDFASLCQSMCHRHLGIGADGLLVLDRPDSTLRMRMWNPDGSESEMCGNGLRCFAQYALDQTYEIGAFNVLTGAGLLSAKSDAPGQITVGLGQAKIGASDVPLAQKLTGQEVSMGNPHVVIFVPDVKGVDLLWLGPEIENLPRYPHRTNVHFVQVISRSEIRAIHWERGVGATLACGTGMAASVAAGVFTNQLDRKVKVNVPGGITQIEISEYWDVSLTGEAKIVFTGEF